MQQVITKPKARLSPYLFRELWPSGDQTYPNISPTAFLVDRAVNVYFTDGAGGIDRRWVYKQRQTNA